MRDYLYAIIGAFVVSRLIRSEDPKTIPNIPIINTDTGKVEPPEYKNDPLFETRFCPQYWFSWKRPKMFTVVPLAPGSAERWKESCRAWLQMRKLGLEIKALEPIVNMEKQPADVKRLQDLKNKQAFLFNETKRIANDQFGREAQYMKFLKLNFSNEEINEFYKERRQQIIDRVWPKVDTQIVPVSDVDYAAWLTNTGSSAVSV